jgi:2-desacetyl-2-hydroxyethyl bacteriochlorophyllide A dehydrogenase
MTALPTHTRAICFTRPLTAELHHGLRLPAMDDDGLLVRTEFSTISRGTELDLYTGQMHGQGLKTQWYPMLPGYMPVGIVEAVGANVSHVAVGDRVVGSNLFACDERYCAAWAGHTEYVVFSRQTHPGLAAQRAVRVPEQVPAEHAGLAMLAGVAWHGVREKVKPAAGEIVLVIGQGVIGQFSAQLCRTLGARVLVADRHESRLAVARSNGIGEGLINSGPNLKEDVLALTGGQAPDIVIEVTGELGPLRQALDIVRPGGRVQAQGMYLDPAPPELLRTLFGKNLTLTSTVSESPQLTGETLARLADGRLTTHGLLTELAAPADAGRVYNDVYRAPQRTLTCAFDWRL